MGRRPCCEKKGLNRGAWTVQEDELLVNYVKAHGEGRWRDLPERAGLNRCGKSCRLRWLNYLRPDIKRGNISADEEDLIIRLHRLLGNRWALIAGRLPGRTDNEIKNYWNTNLGKRVKRQRDSASSSNLQNITVDDDSPQNLHVMRPRASKCTNYLSINFAKPPSSDTINATVERPPSVHGVSSTERQLEPINGFSSSFAAEDTDPWWDFRIDFDDAWEFCSLGFMDPIFSDLTGFTSTNHENSNLVSPSGDQPLVSSQEMPQDDVASNGLHCFTSDIDNPLDQPGV